MSTSSAPTKAAMPSGTVSLPSGGTAELQTQPTNAEYTSAFKVIVGITEAAPADKLDRIPDFVAIFLTSWTAKDRAGAELGIDSESISRSLQVDLIAVYQRATQIFKAIEIPKT
jgi:hypothetical protein